MWRFDKDGYGRPHISGPDYPGGSLSFNVSHTESVILFGVVRQHRLGVDVEAARHPRNSLGIVDRFFSAQEAAALRSLPMQMQPERFSQYWTLKESYIKARGEGLSMPLDKFSFDLSRENHIGISFDGDLNETPGRWRFWLFKPSPHYTAAVCVERAGGTTQKLVTRKVVPLEFEEPCKCRILRS